MDYSSTIDSSDLGKLPRITFPGNILVVDSVAQTADAVRRLSQYPALGFDTETKPNFAKGERHKVALLQLAADDCAFLFRLHRTGIPRTLLTLLANNSIKKVGAAVHDDLKALKKICNFQPEGFIDLQNVVTKHGIEEKSVRKMAAIVLNVRISKSQRLTNWERSDLDLRQQLYAATDAWICLQIYNKLEETITQ